MNMEIVEFPLKFGMVLHYKAHIEPTHGLWKCNTYFKNGVKVVFPLRKITVPPATRHTIKLRDKIICLVIGEQKIIVRYSKNTVTLPYNLGIVKRLLHNKEVDSIEIHIQKLTIKALLEISSKTGLRFSIDKYLK